MCNAHGHPAGCTCGFGGEGHLGKSCGFHEASSPSFLRNVLSDFCRPTRCAYCREYVYFVRHNGGSVWLEALGKPWPKHKCYYDERYFTREQKKAQKATQEWVAKLRGASVGVVIDIEMNTQNEKFLLVRTLSDEQELLKVYVSFSIQNWIGEFVVFSKAERKLIRPYVNTDTVIEIEPHQNVQSNTNVFTENVAEGATSLKPHSYNLPYLSQLTHPLASCSICGVKVREDKLEKHSSKMHK